MVIKSKYIKEISFFTWFIFLEIDTKGGFVIWDNFIKIFHWIRKWTTWDIKNGKSVWIRIDLYVRDNERYKLSIENLEHIEESGLTTLNQIQRPQWVVIKDVYWFNFKDIGLFGTCDCGCGMIIFLNNDNFFRHWMVFNLSKL